MSVSDYELMTHPNNPSPIMTYSKDGELLQVGLTTWLDLDSPLAKAVVAQWKEREVANGLGLPGQPRHGLRSQRTDSLPKKGCK